MILTHSVGFDLLRVDREYLLKGRMKYIWSTNEGKDERRMISFDLLRVDPSTF